MDNFASGVTKAITEFLEQNAKRQTAQQTTLETHEKLLDSLQASIESLKTKGEELTNENVYLKGELKNYEEYSRKTNKDITETKAKYEELAKENATLRGELKSRVEREEQTDKDVSEIKFNIGKLHGRLGELEGWTELTTAIADEIKSLSKNRDLVNEKLSEFAKHIRRLQSTSRIPTKSPSASAYLNGNTHGSLPRLKPVFHKSNLLLESPDPDESISELSDHAERLKRGLEELNELNRSFEKNSFYSDDWNISLNL